MLIQKTAGVPSFNVCLPNVAICLRTISSNCVKKKHYGGSRIENIAFYFITGKNNVFPFLDILGYLKNTHKNPKFGKVRQVPTREFPTKFPN